ncbi:MAG: putative metal-binding motif-containing protein [Deltaproteobacteria bacterium]|nr:putative metal-binding motif-containing protein [Deltaproteobacteria bacterium]
MHTLLWLLVVAGCTPGSDDDTSPADVDTDVDADTDSDTDTDTDEPGTDDDRDGWTVEEGDCDDNDVWVNPGWDERPNDDRDNDCDGRIDEVFAGVIALRVDSAQGGTSLIRRIDSLGDLTQTWDLTGGPGAAMGAYWFDERLDRNGWLATNYAPPSVFWVDPAGTASQLWSAEEEPTIEPERFANGLWGIASHPDGYAVASAGDMLLRVDDDGSASIVAEWPAFEEDGSHDLFASAIAANPLDGTVGLFGYYGGYATWSPEDGYALVRAEDPMAPTGGNYDAHSDEKGRFYTLGWQWDGSEATVGIFRWNPDTERFVLKGAWKDSTGDDIDFSPVAFGIDAEGGDFYVTANGGWKRTVWRVFGGADSYASVLYPDPETLGQTPPPEDEFRFFRALAVVWDED